MIDPVWLDEADELLQELKKELDQFIVLGWECKQNDFERVESDLKRIDSSNYANSPIFFELDKIKESNIEALITLLEEWADRFNTCIDEYKSIINDSHK